MLKDRLYRWLRQVRADGLPAVRVVRRGQDEPVRTWAFKDHPASDDEAIARLLVEAAEGHARTHQKKREDEPAIYFMEALLSPDAKIGERRFTCQFGPFAEGDRPN